MCKSVQKRLNEIYTLDSRKELITVTCPLHCSLICRHKHKLTTQDLCNKCKNAMVGVIGKWHIFKVVDFYHRNKRSSIA